MLQIQIISGGTVNLWTKGYIGNKLVQVATNTVISAVAKAILTV